MPRASSLEKTGGQEEKRAAENETAGWLLPFNGDEFEQDPGDSEGQGSLAGYSP